MEDRYLIAFYGDCIEDLVIYTTGMLRKLGYSCAVADYTEAGHIADYLPLPQGMEADTVSECGGMLYHHFDRDDSVNCENFLSDVIIFLFDDISDRRLEEINFDKSFLVINENVHSLRRETTRTDVAKRPDSVIIRNFTGLSWGILPELSEKYNVRNIYALQYNSQDAVTLFRKGLFHDSEFYRVSPGMREVIHQLIDEILPGVDDMIVGKAVTRLFGRWR